jgi:hypothetical protein
LKHSQVARPQSFVIFLAGNISARHPLNRGSDIETRRSDGG